MRSAVSFSLLLALEAGVIAGPGRPAEANALRRAYFRAETPAARERAAPFTAQELPGGVICAEIPPAMLQTFAASGLTFLGYEVVLHPAPIVTEEVQGGSARAQAVAEPQRPCPFPSFTPRVGWGIKAMYDDPTLIQPSGGAGVRVGVIDTGVSPHLDLVRRLVKCMDLTPSDFLPPCADSMNHGTLVASVIAADGGADGLGMWGMAPEVSIYSYRVCEPNRECWGAYVAAGIYAAIADSMNIINMSLDGPGHDVAIQAAIDDALAHNILVVASTGNSPPFSYVGWPAAYPEVLSVGALTEHLDPWQFTTSGINDGDYVRELQEVEVAAPGAAVLAGLKGGCWVLGSGTSLAAPMVAGLAAKLWNGNAAALRTRIQRAARFRDLYTAGDDTLTGFGMPTIRDYSGLYVINAIAGAGGVVSPGGGVAVTPGASQTFTIYPQDSCYVLQDVKVNGASRGPITSFTFTNVRTDQRIEATFASRASYSITASAGTGGTISPGGATTVACGGKMTYRISGLPDCGQVQDVKVDGVSQGPLTIYTFNDVRSNHTISATFILAGTATYTVTTTAVGGGTISPEGTTDVPCGGSRTYTITPLPNCYAIEDVMVDGQSQGPVSSYTFTNMASDHTITATFYSAGSAVITASAGPGGTISPSGASSVICGYSKSYTITPTSCSRIEDLKVDGVSKGALASYTFINVRASHTILATFVGNPLTINASAGPGGTISPSGATTVACGSSGGYTISVTDGCAIVDVKVDGVSQGPISSYTFPAVTTNHSIAATFSTGPYAITASAGPGGTISPAGVSSATCGENRTFAIATSTGCAIQDVTVDGVSRGPISSYTFTNVRANHTIAATFHTGPFTITATGVAGSTISPDGVTTVACGGSQAYTIAPSGSCAIQDVKVDGVSMGPISSYTFTNVLANHTISATVTQGPFTIVATATGGTITPSGFATLACGDSLTYRMTPIGSCGSYDVKVDGVSLGPIPSYTFTNVMSNHSITLTVAAGPFTIVATAGVGGTINPNGQISVGCGASRTYTITRSGSCGTHEVKVDGVSMGPISSYTFTNVTSNHAISATFPGGVYSINASAGFGGSITPSGVRSVACGGSETYSISTNNCYRIQDVKVDGISQGAVSSYTFNTVTAPHTILATFVPVGSFSIISSADAGGTISPSGTASVLCGSSKTYTIAADNCHLIQDVVVDGVSRGPLSSVYFNAVTTGHTIRAYFTVLGPYTIDVSAGAGGTISPGDVSNVACGTTQSYTIAPDECHRIQDVKVDGSWRGPITGYTFISVRENHAIEAVFSELGPFAIDASAGPGGTVSPGGAANVSCGSAASYTIAPADCHAIQDVKVDGVSQGPIATYTFGHVTGGHAIEATFAALGPYTITASAGEGSTIHPAGAASVACGGSLSYTIAPSDCRAIRDILVDGISVGAASGYTFADVHGDHKISATGGPAMALGETHAEPSWASDGTIDLTVSGGVPPYLYDWSNGAASEDLAGLRGGTYTVRVVDAQGCTEDLAITIAGDNPSALALGRPTPNPGPGPVRLRYAVPAAAGVRLSVVDVQGREVAVLAEGTQPPGWSWASWNGRTGSSPAPGGIYFIRLQAGGRQIVQRFALVR